MKQHLTCFDHDGCEHLVPPQDLRFRPSVYGIMLEGDKVLLSPQWEGYDFPGGGVNIDESLEEAVVREFKEETGLDVRPLQVVYASTSFYYLSEREKTEKHWNCPLIYFLVEKVGGSLSLDHAEDYEKEFMKIPEWLPLDALEGLRYHNGLGVKSPAVARLAKNIKDKI